MKTTIRILTIGSLAALVGYAFEEMTDLSNKSEINSEKTTATLRNADSEKNDELLSRMKQQQVLIAARLGISSSFDAEETTNPDTGVDLIQELYDSGYIIPATLEEVEAAINAAAQTTGNEDDIKAYQLRHRGSYRFFLPN